MSWQAWLQFAVLVALVFATTPVLGAYLARVFAGAAAPGDRVFLPVERVVYRVAGVDPEREQPWTVYALSLLAFSVVSVLGLYPPPAPPGRPAAEPDRRRRACRPRSRSTPRSASSRTRTGRTTAASRR